jgi:hypothetical protein
MVDQITLQTIGILLTGLTVSIAAIYYTLTLRYTRRNQELQLETRQAQLFMQIYDRFVSREFQLDWRAFLWKYEWDNYDDFMEQTYGVENIEVSSNISSIFHYFEGVGVLVEEGLIDVNLVAKLLSASVIQCWEKVEPYVREQRERFGLPRIFDKTEYLYNEMKRVRGDDWSYTSATQILEPKP